MNSLNQQEEAITLNFRKKKTEKKEHTFVTRVKSRTQDCECCVRQREWAHGVKSELRKVNLSEYIGIVSESVCHVQNGEGTLVTAPKNRSFTQQK